MQRDRSNDDLLGTEIEDQSQHEIFLEHCSCSMDHKVPSQRDIAINTEISEWGLAYNLQNLGNLDSGTNDQQKVFETINKIRNIARELCELVEYDPPTLQRSRDCDGVQVVPNE